MGEEKREPETLRVASLVVRDENSEETALYILEGTRLNSCFYIFAMNSEGVDEDGACYLSEDVPGADDVEVAYGLVENEEEVGYMPEIFQTTLEDEGADIDLFDEQRSRFYPMCITGEKKQTKID